MAFHPFKHFRKRQKIYLACLTILTMIIFVAQFGAGDPFTRLQQWIGMAVPHGDPILELYGKKIYEEDLTRLRWRRDLASEFAFYNAGIVPPLQKTLSDIQKKYGDKKSKTEINPVSNALDEITRAIGEASMKQQPEERLLPLRNALAILINEQLTSSAVQKDVELYHAIDALATNLTLQIWALDPRRKPSDSYFGGNTSRYEDQLDFLVWKHQADQLGITLTQGDVCLELNRAWGNGDFLTPNGRWDKNEYVVNFFQTNNRYHKSLRPDDLLSALTDEFRVNLAKKMLLGSSSGVRSYREAVDGIHISPSAATPDEFYQYFKDQRTTLSLMMLPISVDSFVDKVESKPSETDLVNLYERYKNDEPSPTRRQPGFKQPRRIKTAYFSYQLEGPYARKMAGKALELLPAFRFGQLASTAFGSGPAWAASVAGYAEFDTLLLSLYEDYKKDEDTRSKVRYDLDDTNRFGQPYDLMDAHAVETVASAATVGELLGGLATGSTTLGAPLTWLGTNEFAERATLTSFASAVLAGGGDGVIAPFGAVVMPMRFRHAQQPFDNVRDQLVERFQIRLARQMMEGYVQNLRKELEEVLAKHSEEKLDELLKKAKSEGAIENVHVMTTLRTKQEIVDNVEPDLADLRFAYDKSLENPLQAYGEIRPDFATLLFHPFGPTQIELQMARFGMKIEPKKVQQFLSFFRDVGWVFFRFDDQPARVRPYADISKEVRDAWIFDQARKLAREAAKRINEEIKEKYPVPDLARRFLVEQKLGRLFDLDNVARLVGPAFAQPGRRLFFGDYRPYQAPREFIAYPPPDFVDQLLKLKRRGESMVVADQPVRHFYIAVLREDPRPPDMKDFQDVYSLQMPSKFGSPILQESLWDKMMGEKRRKYEQTLLEQLRSEATKSLRDGEYDLPDTLRNRSEINE
jgi:hypothetical protein